MPTPLFIFPAGWFQQEYIESFRGTAYEEEAKKRPKGLHVLNGKPVIDYAMEHIAAEFPESSAVIVTNKTYADRWKDWHQKSPHRSRTHLYENGVRLPAGANPEDFQLGTLEDFWGGLTTAMTDALYTGGPVLLCTSDKVPREFSYRGFVRFGLGQDAVATVLHRPLPTQDPRNHGVARMDRESKRITYFQEKPGKPLQSFFIPVAYYFFPEPPDRAIRWYLDSGGRPDPPGRFIEQLVQDRHTRVFGYEIAPDALVDVGTKGNIERAEQLLTSTGPRNC